MAIVYGVLGLVVILTAGTFGTINSSPWFNLGIAILFVVLALAMFDVLRIDFSKYSGNLGIGIEPRHRSRSRSAWARVAALLAGACVAPVVIQVVLFSSNLYATGTKVALALPFCLGRRHGDSVADRRRRPRRAAQAGHVDGARQAGLRRLHPGDRARTTATRRIRSSRTAGSIPPRSTSSVEEQLKAGWHASLAEGLDIAQREQKPVLIDMWATWCKNCLTMDKTTLENADVQKALSGYVKIKYQAEDPDDAARQDA